MNHNLVGLGRRWQTKRVVLCATAVTAALVASVLMAVWIVNRYVTIEIEEARGQRSVRVYTPLGIFPLQRPKQGIGTLMAVIYPGSSSREQVSSDWYRGPAGREEKVAQLTVLQFQIGIPLTLVEVWYRERLGLSFARNKGWPIERERDREEWVREVLGERDQEAIVFLQQAQGRVRGVILQAQSGGSVLATLYDYQETEGQ